MSRHRYDPIPQRPNSIPPPSSNSPYDPIILSPIPVSTPSHNYSFNTGLPTSTSQSIISQTPSIPASPPPSFHTFSSPGTPRPTPSTRTVMSASTGSGIAGPYGELWGVAESTVGGEGVEGSGIMGIRGGGDAGTIQTLHQRIEWLEESIGRLLLEKEKAEADSGVGADKDGDRNNCCISFTDASPDVERAIMRGKSNCCVSFRRTGEKRERRERKRNFAVAVSVVGFMVFVILVVMNGLKPHSVRERVYEKGGKEYYTTDKGVGEVED